jgi:SAM-dependent methyltransferase
MNHSLVVHPSLDTAAAHADQIRAFYDEQIVNKIADFVDGNPRVDAAWQTIQQWAPRRPRRVLDIGCGFGQIAWQMSQRWSTADVTGIDISPRSIALASRVFQAPNLAYATTALDALDAGRPYDLVTLVDVYEHIAEPARLFFNAALARVMAPDATLIVTCPTPEYQRFLRRAQPDKLQPVDEDVDGGVLHVLATATRARLVMFREHSIWLEGDYQHAVFSRPVTLAPVERLHAVAPALWPRAVGKWRRWRRGPEPGSRDHRLQMIERTLGAGVYRPR